MTTWQRRRALVLALLGCIGSVAPAAAQNQNAGGSPAITPPILEQPAAPATQQPAQQQAPAAAQANPAPDVPEQAPAGPATAAGAPSTVTPFADWSLECFDPAVDGIGCQITHRVVSGNGAQVVLVMSLAYLPANKETRVQIALPLGVSLSDGVQLAIGNEVQGAIPISRCTARGCIIEGSASDEFIAAMRAGARGAVIVRTETGSPVQLPFSLLGFTDSYGAMLARNDG